MTTYVFGAGASAHAGYPLCAELWPRLLIWIIESEGSDSEFRQAVELITALTGPVTDIEALFTDLDLNRGVFSGLQARECRILNVTLRKMLSAYFKTIRQNARLYAALAKRIEKGDVVVTFNYDLCLENELSLAGKFRVRDGYGFETEWDEEPSDVTILKLHGSLNSGPNAYRSGASRVDGVETRDYACIRNRKPLLAHSNRDRPLVRRRFKCPP